jgi:hypothetical protein
MVVCKEVEAGGRLKDKNKEDYIRGFAAITLGDSH